MTTDVKVPRTLDEIRARVEWMKKVDVLGWALSDLRIYLPEHAVDFTLPIKNPPTAEEALALIRDYLPFAFEKALNHRGLSAERSMHHLANWAWLAGREDLSELSLDEKTYPYYGVPILRRFASELGVSLPPRLETWPNGRPCHPGCQSCK